MVWVWVSLLISVVIVSIHAGVLARRPDNDPENLARRSTAIEHEILVLREREERDGDQ